MNNGVGQKIFKTSIPRDIVMMSPPGLHVAVRAALELQSLKEVVESLDGDISDYGANTEDHGIVHIDLGEGRERREFQTVFTLFPFKDGNTKLSDIVDEWEQMAAPPVIRC